MSEWREKDYLSVKDLQTILEVSEHTAYVIMHSLPLVKMGKRLIRIRKTVFEHYLRQIERK